MSQPGAALVGTGHIANGLTVGVGLGAQVFLDSGHCALYLGITSPTGITNNDS